MSIYDKASLVLIPSGTKTSKVYSQKPTNGDGDFTFSRSTAATRVNASGNIEKETQNLLLQSNQFDTTWTNVGLALTSGQSGYDGTSNAWKIEATSAVVRLVQANTTSGVQTFSVYAKAGNVDIIRFQTQNGGTDIFFNVNTGSIVSALDPKIDATIEAAGNGFYRCTLTYNETLNEIRILPQRSAFSVLIGDYIYIQDAQLEQGLVARDYIKTTTTAIYGGITDNVPRLDYTDSSCPALLLEPQRTNIVPNGDYIEGLLSRVNSIVTSNYGISPEGVQNSTRVQKASSTDGYQYFLYAVSPSTTYTMSVYAKGSGTIRWNFYDGTSAQSSPFTNLTSEWVRYTFTATSNSTTSNGDFGFFISDDAEVYGFQMEAGSYATSYIPTYGSAVTRNVDTAKCLGFSARPTDFPFTIFSEIKIESTTEDIFPISFADTDSSIKYYAVSYGETTGKFIMYNRSGTLIVSPPSTNSFAVGTHKVCAIWSSDTNMKLYVDGTKEVDYNHTSNTFNTDVEDIHLGFLRTAADTGSRNSNNSLLVFNQALTDQEAIDLTTI